MCLARAGSGVSENRLDEASGEYRDYPQSSLNALLELAGRLVLDNGF